MSEQSVPSMTPREAAARPDAGEPDERTLVVLGLVELFQEQLDAWRQAGHIGVPILTWPDAPAPAAGRCLSCGDRIAGRWRCELCRQAVELVLEQDDHVDRGPAGAGERVHDARLAEVESDIAGRRWNATPAWRERTVMSEPLARAAEEAEADSLRTVLDAWTRRNGGAR